MKGNPDQPEQSKPKDGDPARLDSSSNQPLLGGGDAPGDPPKPESAHDDPPPLSEGGGDHPLPNAPPESSSNLPGASQSSSPGLFVF